VSIPVETLPGKDLIFPFFFDNSHPIGQPLAYPT
jgi:hypothetical protein